MDGWINLLFNFVSCHLSICLADDGKWQYSTQNRVNLSTEQSEKTKNPKQNLLKTVVNPCVWLDREPCRTDTENGGAR